MKGWERGEGNVGEGMGERREGGREGGMGREGGREGGRDGKGRREGGREGVRMWDRNEVAGGGEGRKVVV